MNFLDLKVRLENKVHCENKDCAAGNFSPDFRMASLGLKYYYTFRLLPVSILNQMKIHSFCFFQMSLNNEKQISIGFSCHFCQP